uniref:Dpy-19 like C-mannosyltransferase 1 n=1 Tax=Hucho hucho TaxID=62062 RepID=A0A4W5K8N9_9TELE
MTMKTRRSGIQAHFCPESDDEELFNSTKGIPNDGKGKRVAFDLHANKRQARKLGITVRYFRNIGITVIIGKFQYLAHLTNLFENDKHFSHLSLIEKEMAFHTEMGLYYSYFKVFINAPSFLHGLHLVTNDRFSEYPLVINALKRFNLYPEVFLSSLFRIYTGTMDFFGIPTKACWNVNRADGLNPVVSCEGMGDAAYFYVSCVFLLNGAMMSLFFLYGTYLSGSRLGGVVTVLCLFFNHGESTRVMWTPPLRESFSYPFFVLQMLLLTRILRYIQRSLAALGACNVLFLLPWPFAQFVLLTQIACLFACYFMGYLSTSKMKSLLVVHLASFAICFSTHLMSIAVSMFPYEGVNVCMTLTSPCVSLYFPQAHIGNLIRSKLTNYKDFHTLMYTCAAEFNFMELETLLGYVKTLILPVNIVIVAIISGKVRHILEFDIAAHLSQFECILYAHTFHCVSLPVCACACQMVYHSLQLVAFAVVAILVMRIKLFLAPLMCLMASLICSRQLFGWIGEHFKHHITVFGILSIMAIQGVANFQSQRGIVGDFSNLPQEQLLEWINTNTMPSESCHVTTYSYMPEIWDVEDQENRGKLPLCTLLSTDSRPHFTTMFENKVYKVLKIPKAAKYDL